MVKPLHWGTLDDQGFPTLHFRLQGMSAVFSRFFPVANGRAVIDAYEQQPHLYKHLIMNHELEME